MFWISTCVLTLQVLQTRIFAYSLDSLTIYLAISVCMLGLGASGTLLALLPPVTDERARAVAGAAAASGAVAVLIAHVVFAANAWTLREAGTTALVTLVALTLPYFCFGLAIALLLVSRAESIGRAYAFNLAGSALGCVVVFPLLDAIGAERSIVAVSMAALASALLLVRPRGRIAGGLALLPLIVGLAFLRAPNLLVFPPEYSGQLNTLLRVADVLRDRHPQETFTIEGIFRRWDRTARVDVYRVETSLAELQGSPTESLCFMQDASAGSILLHVEDDLGRAREFFDESVYGAGYVRAKPRDVLIIGLGGGPDVLAALYHGAERIVGVEINRATINLVREDFAAYLGRPYEQPGVTIHQIDGRTFLRSSEDQFDQIQLSGVDTKALLSAGSLSVNENYMYTREAMGEMLRRLRPNGIIAINRFGDHELHRLSSVAIAGLRDIGVTTPERHLFALEQGGWRSLLVKRTPFTMEELDRLHSWAAVNSSRVPDIRIPCFDWITLSLSRPVRILYSPEPRPVASTQYFEALQNGTLDQYIASQRDLDLSANVDDRPYFFFYEHPWRALKAALSRGTGTPSQNQAALRTLHSLLSKLGIVATVFILAPLLAFRWRGLRAPGAGRTLCYFSALGVAFMFVEIGLIQRFVLLLGHQSYAISVVLLGLLLGASIGSSWSTRIDIGSRRGTGTVICMLAAVILVYAEGLGPLFALAAPAPFWLRLALALVLLVGLGMLLGIPFPTALRSLQTAGLPFTAWAIGINGFGSVIGAALAVEVSLLAGLRVLLLAGVVLYLVAAATAPVGLRRRASG